MGNVKILVTGATGATGGTAIKTLLELKVSVRALVHKTDPSLSVVDLESLSDQRGDKCHERQNILRTT